MNEKRWAVFVDFIEVYRELIPLLLKTIFFGYMLAFFLILFFKLSFL